MTTLSKEITFSTNPSIDRAIKAMLPCFSQKSQRRMQRAILKAKKAAEKYGDENTDAGARHIFREFIPAFSLNQNGFRFEYDERIEGKKPDWLDSTAGLMMESYTYERGGSSQFLGRVASAVSDKCEKYKDIVSANSLRFIVAVYLDFIAAISLEECRENAPFFRSVFEANKSLWAIVFFTETHVVNGRQQYAYLCFCVDSYFESFSNWPFKETIKLSE